MVDIRDSTAFRQLIRSRRRAVGITQEELAQAVGRQREWVIRLETGKTQPNLDAAIRAASALGLRVSISVAPDEPDLDFDLTAGVDFRE